MGYDYSTVIGSSAIIVTNFITPHTEQNTRKNNTNFSFSSVTVVALYSDIVAITQFKNLFIFLFLFYSISNPPPPPPKKKKKKTMVKIYKQWRHYEAAKEVVWCWSVYKGCLKMFVIILIFEFLKHLKYLRFAIAIIVLK